MFTQLTGYNRTSKSVKTRRCFSSGRHDKAFYDQMWQAHKRGKAYGGGRNLETA